MEVCVTRCTRAKIKRMVELHRDGITIKEIAKRYKHSGMTVARWLRCYDKYGEDFFAKH